MFLVTKKEYVFSLCVHYVYVFFVTYSRFEVFLIHVVAIKVQYLLPFFTT